jgi:HlyD family secretion protein
MRIANLNNMEVHVEVNENDIVRVSIGDTAVIEVDAYLKDKFKGLVTEIATSANTTGTSADQVTNFDVKVLLLSSSYAQLAQGKPEGFSPFRPGMSASVPSVEIAAVTTRDDTTGKNRTSYEKRKLEQELEKDSEKAEALQKEVKEFVFVYDNGVAKIKEVKTGIQDNRYIEIISGLNEGDEVISGPYSAVSKDLKNDDKVEKTDKENLFIKKD